MKGEVADIELGLRDANFLQSTGIPNIYTATSIDQDIAQSVPTDERIHNESMLAWEWHMSRMIRPIETNRHL